MPEEILEAHNKYRAEVNVAPLTWSDTLASNAQEWANHLASLGGNTLQHSPNSGEGENLWLGTSGAFTYTQMVDMWGEEKQYFVDGTFPDVSSTGNWFDVGHYTQMVWGDTTEVGCAIANAGGNDILVCRYNPPGNYLGQPVF
ncbi:SCP-like extracellular [Oculatella sp. FACHB-28]|nr:SCP-like extracellular [Cyanobacteria bacterium FACHB-471]MBD2057261.1 SCP-like extracellular [Oculatella sp. FACHB-28]MBD2072178.1 SCP-like extracellular [Leptolyngbya sp. FACHB-671]